MAVAALIVGALALTVAILASRGDTPNPTTTTRPAPTTTTTVAGACDPSLWRHVYHPARLRVVRPCLTVEGTIAHVAREADGDTHVRLTPDAAYRWTLRPANSTGQHGDLVLEPVCVRSPTQVDAVAACTGYRSPVAVPAVGTHVRVTGAYVYDLDHGGWAELHPVTTIRVVP